MCWVKIFLPEILRSKEDFGPRGAGFEVGGPVNQMPLESYEVSWDRGGHHGQDGGQ